MALHRSTDSDNFMVSTPAERRAAVLRQEEERAAIRQSELAAQASPLIEPHERIRLWERLHALRLPLAANHKLLNVIAEQTELTIAQVKDEQVRRATGAPASGSEP
jgi:hypothetical protein